MKTSHHIDLDRRPRRLRDGGELYLPRNWVERYHEYAVTYGLICNRKLFGECYSILMPEVFETLGHDGGVMIGAFIDSSHLISSMISPGDVDLLIIPYNENRLLISETLTIEVKILRGRFSRQGKAPNEFGFSQAEGTLSHGFPYSAVAHLIVSDASPPEHWQTLLSARVADSVTGRLDKLKKIKIDAMPLNLINRSYGRLEANCHHKDLGLLAAYVSMDTNRRWIPSGKAEYRNEHTLLTTLQSITNFYQNNFKQFIDTPKY